MDEQLQVMHDDIFGFLLEQKDEDGSPLLFKPREKNNAQKLENGYWFLEDDRYIHISFWKGEDSDRKINNIAFVVWRTGNCYIELSNKKKHKLSSVFHDIRKTIGGKWTERRKKGWGNGRKKQRRCLLSIGGFLWSLLTG